MCAHTHTHKGNTTSLHVIQKQNPPIHEVHKTHSFYIQIIQHRHTIMCEFQVRKGDNTEKYPVTHENTAN
jgi:hypothetical protein